MHILLDKYNEFSKGMFFVFINDENEEEQKYYAELFFLIFIDITLNRQNIQ
jgi:hypothetical protein